MNTGNPSRVYCRVQALIPNTEKIQGLGNGLRRLMGFCDLRVGVRAYDVTPSIQIKLGAHMGPSNSIVGAPFIGSLSGCIFVGECIVQPMWQCVFLLHCCPQWNLV